MQVQLVEVYHLRSDPGGTYADGAPGFCTALFPRESVERRARHCWRKGRFARRPRGDMMSGL